MYFVIIWYFIFKLYIKIKTKMEFIILVCYPYLLSIFA